MRIHYPRERWSQAYTANVSIGQGYDLVTPLQLAMVYATVANGGVSYYPKLVQSVTSFEGKPLVNEKGELVVSDKPKIHRDLRFDFPAQQIQLARRGLWKVVNEDGGTGRVARLNGVQVAGKTGTAQAMTEGKKDTIAWFACFAPFDNPKYTIVVMVQGGEHGGSVAAPIATRILERALAMDQGNFQQQVAWVAPAHKSNPFQMIPAVTFKDSNVKIDATDEENLDGNSNTDMANTTADPSVEPEADAGGKVQKKVMRPVVVATPPPRKLSFFERLFGARPKPTPAPTPPPKQKPVRR
jgi:penicillin-binding protein 2